MEQYILKKAVFAEIIRMYSLLKKEEKVEKSSANASQTNVISLGARIAMLEEILSVINTLEVIDVDKEVVRSKVMDETIHDKAIRLAEGWVVEMDGHLYKLGFKPFIVDACSCCDLNSQCYVGSKIFELCSECESITKKFFLLEINKTVSSKVASKDNA